MGYFINTLAPNEKRVLTFDFTSDLSDTETLIGSPTVTISVVIGTDSTPSSIQDGEVEFDSTNKMVLFPMQAIIADNDYNITIVANTTNIHKIVSMSGIISIKR